MTVYLYNDAIFTRSNIAIAGYGGYAETTDVYNNATGAVITFTMSGPLDLVFRSYGGHAFFGVDGVVYGYNVASGSGARDVVVPLPSGSHTVTVFDPSSPSGPNYAFAKLTTQASGTYPTSGAATFPYNGQQIRETNITIANYGGYGPTTNVFFNSVTNFWQTVVGGPCSVTIYSYGGWADLSIDGTSQGSHSVSGNQGSGAHQTFVLGPGFHLLRLDNSAANGGANYAFDHVVIAAADTNLTPSPVAILLVIPVPTITTGQTDLRPNPVAIPLVVPAPTIAVYYRSLAQFFTLGSVYASLSQPFGLLAPAFTVTLHQLFDLTGPLGATLSQPFDLIADAVGTSLRQLFDLLAVGMTGGGDGAGGGGSTVPPVWIPPPGSTGTIPPLWQPLMVFDKAGIYLGSISIFNVTNPPVRYLRSRRVTNEGGMTFNVPRSSPDIGLIASDRLVRLQSVNGEKPWWGTMSPQVSAGGIEEVTCRDPFTVLRDGAAITLVEEVGDGTPATGVYARIMGIHNDLRAATGEAQWELDLAGSRPFHGDLDLDTDTLSALDLIIARSRTEIACDSRLEGNRLVPILRVRDAFSAGAGAAIFDGPDGNVVAGVQVIEDPTPLVFSIRLTGMTTDLSKCLPEWAQWALLDVTPEVTVSVDPGERRNRQRLDESLDWGLSKAAVEAQCNAIVDWIWGMYRSFLMAMHDIEGRPWHDGWAYLGPPSIYEPMNAGKDSLSRRAWKTRLQLVEVMPNEPASAVMISEKSSLHNLREWLIVTYDRVAGVQGVGVWAIPTVVGASLVHWSTASTVTVYKVSGGRIVSRAPEGPTGAFVDPYSVRVWDPVAKRYRNLRRIINGDWALAHYIDPSDTHNTLADLGPDAAIDTVSGDGSSLIAKMYDFEADKIDDYDPRRDGIGILKAAPTVFFGAETSRARWHVTSFDVGGGASTNLTTGISATETDFEVDSIMGFPDPVTGVPFLAPIGTGSTREVVLVLSMLGAEWHVVRGQSGTEAIIHEAGAPVGREGADVWAGFPFPYTWPEGAQWAADELAELSKPRIDLGVHVSHFRGDQLTIDYGSTHAVDVATEGPPARWVGTGKRAIGWSTGDGETECVLEWVT